MITAALEQATQIPMQGPRKAALDLALRFEQAILACEPGTRIFGPEQSLVHDFDASPKVVRQALRILESRFLGIVRRGVQGGLALRTPNLSQSAEIMAIYLSAIAVNRQEVSEAIGMLLPEMSDRSDKAKEFVLSLLHALDRSFDDSGPQPQVSERLRALTIARQIVSGNRARAMNTPFGTLATLEEKYGCGRPVIVQAIRILEELEVLECRPGRTGGIVLRQPSPGAVVRAVYAHFVLGDLTVDTASEIIWSINRANAVRASRIITEDQIKMLDSISVTLRSVDVSLGDHTTEITLWRMLGDITGNKIIHMLVRYLFYFRVSSLPTISAYLKEPTSDAIRANACVVARAVCARRPDGARQAVKCAEAISREDIEGMAASKLAAG